MAPPRLHAHLLLAGVLVLRARATQRPLRALSPHGRCIRALVGQALQGPLGLQCDSDKNTDAGVYALMGATAALSGMARITVSLAVILMEASGTVNWALPIFVVTMCSKWAGDVFTIGLYDIHIELKKVPLLHPSPEKQMLTLQAQDVMTRSITSFNPSKRFRGSWTRLARATTTASPLCRQMTSSLAL